MYIHIGLGKCSTSYLQQHIFPKISSILNYEYFYPNTKFLKKFDYLNYTAHPFENKKIKFPFKSFLSLEMLIWDLFYNPFYYEKASKINSKLFSKKSNIIITIREPKSFVTSVYSELLSNIFTIKQKDYFVTQKYFKEENKYFFDYKKLSYEKLISFYLNKFDVVYLVKYEDAKNLKLWSKIFKNNNIKKIKIKNKVINKSLSKFTLYLAFYTNNFLKIFWMDLRKYSFNYKEFLRKYIEKWVIKFNLYKTINIDEKVVKTINRKNKKFYNKITSGKFYKKRTKIIHEPFF